MGLLDHKVLLFLIFGGTSTLFSIMAVQIYIANPQIKGQSERQPLFIRDKRIAILEALTQASSLKLSD